MKILDIEKGSIADELGIFPGDELISINGHPITDQLDYKFYQSDEELEVLIRHENEEILYDIEKEPHEDLGLILEPLKLRICGNKCIFCFVYQNPKGLRKTLYIKDEDYRFSFLYGHYVTLTNAKENDLKRIVEQRMTPLYISVHATDPELRKLLLGIQFEDHLLEKLDYLTKNGIEIHTQIVLCPELNDGDQLVKTVNDLAKFYPGIRSVAVVPVGLTRHRKNLFPIKPVTDEYASQTIDFVDRLRQLMIKKIGDPFVYCSDEFFIRTGREIPDESYYGEFYQLENGVGLTRNLIQTLINEKNLLKRKNSKKKKFTFISGILGSIALNKYIIPDLKNLGYEIELKRVTNQFYGESITVAGLLVGQDIYNTLKSDHTGDYIVLPPRCLNEDQLFLDDWSLELLEEKIGKKCIPFPGSFVELMERVEEYEKAGYRYSG
jgi:putative radical SAM enzyme (TIGR03279 family)